MTLTGPSTHPRRTSSLTPALPLALLAGSLLLAPLAGPLQASDTTGRWFHVQVQEGDSGAEVEVNLPLSLIETVLDNLPESLDHDLHVELDDTDFEVAELRQIWSEIRDGEEATYVTVKDPDQTVVVRRAGGFLLAETTERRPGGAEVNVRVPVAVIDALFAGDPDRLDLAAAVRALAESGERDIVTVRDRDSTVRIWIDDRNSAD